ncbi:heparin lyase I family protein [Erysipelothrix anatis]|uniref:heparin lyase I family protein n=1 Tax=Erysipelothrix anatis TaxID=2683713 RepID=UPI00135CE77E|nr:heparin lyase I family protein [Erysipelothrix anatis]
MKILSVIVLLLLSGCSIHKEQSDYSKLIDESNLVFREDFEGGNLKALSLEGTKKESFVIMSDFKDKKNHMLKVSLEQNDIVNNGNRAEFKKDLNEKSGDILLYKVDFMIDKQYPNSSLWQSIFQLHDKPDFGNGETWSSYAQNPVTPPFMIDYIDNHLSINFSEYFNTRVIEPVLVEKDKWYTLAVHYNHSKDGYVEVFLDGKTITSGKVFYPTIYNDEANYVKIGLYRDKSIEDRGVIYYDNFEIFKY